MPAATPAEDRKHRREQVGNLYAKGLSLREIAPMFGVSDVTIWNDLSALGIKRRREGRPSTIHPAPEPRRCANPECRKMFKPKGALVAKGRGRYCSHSCAASCRPRGEDLSPRRQRAAELYAKGETLKDIGAALGVSNTTIMHDLAAIGVERRPGGNRVYPVAGARRCANPACRELFTPPSDTVAKGYGRFCSIRCARLCQPRRPRTGSRLITCAATGCENERRVYNSEIKVADGPVRIFCSRSCLAKYRWEHGVGITDNMMVMKHGKFRRKIKNTRNASKPAQGNVARGRPRNTTDKDDVRIAGRLLKPGASVRQVARVEQVKYPHVSEKVVRNAATRQGLEYVAGGWQLQVRP